MLSQGVLTIYLDPALLPSSNDLPTGIGRATLSTITLFRTGRPIWSFGA